MTNTNDEILENDDVFGLDDSANDFIQSQESRGDYNTYLYQIENKREKPSYLEDWENYCPSMREVAEQFGSGKFKLMICFPKRDKADKQSIKSFIFNVSSKWGKKNYNNDNSLAVSGANNVSSINPQEIMFKTAEMMQGMIASMINPILANMSQKQNTSGEQLQIVSLASNLMQQQSESYMNFCESVSNRYLQNQTQNNNYDDDDDDETLQGEKSDVQTMIDQFKDFLPLIMNNDAPAKVAIMALKKTKQYQEMIQDKGKLSKLIQAVEELHGTEKTNEVLQKLKITR